MDFLEQVFDVMQATPRHVYQILTKRPKRMLEVINSLEISDNVWIGVSVESQDYNSRIDYLRQVDASVRFLSCEPLLGSLKLDLTNIDWVIVGGESGAKRRPMKKEWVEDILKQCQDAKVAFFFKQWGGRYPKAGGRELNGKVWDEMPAAWDEHLYNITDKAS
jgi:protein gp37